MSDNASRVSDNASRVSDNASRLSDTVFLKKDIFCVALLFYGKSGEYQSDCEGGFLKEY